MTNEDKEKLPIGRSGVVQKEGSFGSPLPPLAPLREATSSRRRGEGGEMPEDMPHPHKPGIGRWPSLFILSCSFFILHSSSLGEPASADKSIPVNDVRRIVAAVVSAAEHNNAARCQWQGDGLANYYVRSAAAVAAQENLAPRAFLLALGVSLDQTNVLRGNPFTRGYLKQLESDEDRARRLKLLGTPSLKGRADWLQHFAVCAALTVQTDAKTAEQIGILKELNDSFGKSGFSFADLAANDAGIAFAEKLLACPQPRQLLAGLAKDFRGEEYLPFMDDLEDGLPWEQLLERYGGPTDPRFLKACAAVRHCVRQLPVFDKR